MFNLSRLETFVNCGLDQDPFKKTNFVTMDSRRVQRILSMGIKSRAMISIVGERGVGKTRAINSALKKLKVRQVTVRSADKTRLLISDIEQAMILDLSDEKPKRGREIRARQLRRILGSASVKDDVVVVIEESHRLHGMTLRSLKTLREMDWIGETELFTIVLVGQSDPMMKPGVSEVRLRSDVVHMMGLSSDEIRGYIHSTVGHLFTDEAADRLAEIPDAKVFLNLQHMIVRLMMKKASADLEKIDLPMVEAEFEDTREMPRKPAKSRKVDSKDTSWVNKAEVGDFLKSQVSGPSGVDVARAANG